MVFAIFQAIMTSLVQENLWDDVILSLIDLGYELDPDWTRLRETIAANSDLPVFG
jgi:hypothetical protein